jgi:hypothetical protein
MDASDVKDQDRIHLNLPMGGKWFFKQALALQEFIKQVYLIVFLFFDLVHFLFSNC